VDESDDLRKTDPGNPQCHRNEQGNWTKALWTLKEKIVLPSRKLPTRDQKTLGHHQNFGSNNKQLNTKVSPSTTKLLKILKKISKQIQCSVHPLCLHKGTKEFRLRTLQKTPTDANLLIITVKTTAALTNCPAKLTTTTPNSIWYNPLTWLSPSDSRLLKKMIQYLKGYNNKKKKS